MLPSMNCMIAYAIILAWISSAVYFWIMPERLPTVIASMLRNYVDQVAPATEPFKPWNPVIHDISMPTGEEFLNRLGFDDN